MEPPSKVEFSNSSGAFLDCSASGNPQPTIDWLSSDGTSIGDVGGIRKILRNGTLVLMPFPAAAYRQDIHNTVYRCVASNRVGRIISRDVQIRAGESLHFFLSYIYILVRSLLFVVIYMYFIKTDKKNKFMEAAGGEEHKKMIRKNIYFFLPLSFHNIVVSQSYKIEVETLAAPRSCTAILRCIIPTFAKEHVRVVSWVQEPAFFIFPSLQGGIVY
jgi:hypothetical protein